MAKIAVVYHINCPDGFGAAWVAWKKFGNKADYFAVSPRALPEADLDKYSEIYALDTSFDSEVSARLALNARLMTIDHHASSEAEIKETKEFIFDIKHSAAVLAWQYFYPKKKTPWFLRYIEDGDLWKSSLPNAEYVRAYLTLADLDFKNFSKLAKKFETAAGRAEITKSGKIISEYRDKQIRIIANSAYHVEFMGYTVLAVNSSLLVSDVGSYLAKIHPPFGIVWSEHGDRRRFSLRALGSLDVSKLAAKFSGGGHPNAAGFTLPASEPFPWKLVKHHHHE